MKHLQNICLFSLVMMMACEQVVEIELPEYEPRISMSCYYHPEKSRIEAVLFNSLAINSEEPLDAIRDGRIYMYENGQLFGELENPDGNHRYEYRYPPTPIPGNVYMLTAQSEGYSNVSATQIMPYPPVATLDQFINESGIIVNDKEQDIYKMTLEDDTDKDNYYEFRIFTRKKEDAPYGDWSARNLRIPYSQAETVRKALYLKDNSFNGEAHQVELFSNTRDTTKVQIKVQINTITRDKYLFATTLSAYQTAQDNPFAERK